MYAPRVFISMLAVLFVFAVSSYFINGSFLTALLQTFICAVLIQAGYFVGVLYLIRREKLRSVQLKPTESFVRKIRDKDSREEIRTGAAPNFPARDG